MGAYLQHRSKVVEMIKDYIENYNTYLVEIDKQRTELNNNFFSGEALYEQLK
jgi:hypothetical protein